MLSSPTPEEAARLLLLPAVYVNLFSLTAHNGQIRVLFSEVFPGIDPQVSQPRVALIMPLGCGESLRASLEQILAMVERVEGGGKVQ
jgi:hypothetical protein